MFTDDTLICGESTVQLQEKLEMWRSALETKRNTCVRHKWNDTVKGSGSKEGRGN